MQPEILVPLDGSEGSEAAVLPHAVALARAYDTALVLVRVLAPPIMDDALWPPAVSRLSSAAYDEEALIIQTYLTGVAWRLAQTGVAVRTEMLRGDPATCIGERSQRSEVRMVVMRTHARGGLAGWLRGSIAETVLHRSRVPILMVRGSEQCNPSAAVYRRILVALDGSPFAEQALREAQRLAFLTRPTLVLASVVEASMPETTELPDTGLAEAGVVPLWALAEGQAMVAQAQRYLQHVAEQHRRLGLPFVTTLAYGRPAETILRIADEQQVDLIVLATHGRSGVQRLWLGSVAQQVVEHGALPTLLIRPAGIDDGFTHMGMSSRALTSEQESDASADSKEPTPREPATESNTVDALAAR